MWVAAKDRSHHFFESVIFVTSMNRQLLTFFYSFDWLIDTSSYAFDPIILEAAPQLRSDKEFFESANTAAVNHEMKQVAPPSDMRRYVSPGGYQTVTGLVFDKSCVRLAQKIGSSSSEDEAQKAFDQVALVSTALILGCKKRYS